MSFLLARVKMCNLWHVSPLVSKRSNIIRYLKQNFGASMICLWIPQICCRSIHPILINKRGINPPENGAGKIFSIISNSAANRSISKKFDTEIVHVTHYKLSKDQWVRGQETVHQIESKSFEFRRRYYKNILVSFFLDTVWKCFISSTE